jgi:hypothetical protein
MVIKMENIRMSLDEWLAQAVEVNLKSEDDFLKIKETLTRIGIRSSTSKKLFQSCHILHKRGKYYIVHFKELFLLDGRSVNFSQDDMRRRNKIVSFLKKWGLLDVVDPSTIDESTLDKIDVKILSHKDKAEWELIPKYVIGNKN